MITEPKINLQAENARLVAEMATLRAERIHDGHVAFCDGLVGVSAAWRDVAIANLDHLATQSVAVEFGEGEDKAPLLDGFKAMLSTLPSPVQFGEFATNERAVLGTGGSASFTVPTGCDVDPVALATHERARRHQKSNGGSYSDAVAAVT